MTTRATHLPIVPYGRATLSEMAQRRHKEVTAHEAGLPSFRYASTPDDKQMWVKLPLGDDWEAQVRLEPEEGHPVIAELRVVPWARWDAEEPPSLPRGGLTARRLRTLNLGSAVDVAYEHLRKRFERDPDPDSIMSPHRFAARAVAQPRRPGRKGRADSFYAAVAAAYLDALAMGSRQPVKDAAAALSERWKGEFKDIYIRDSLSEARRRGLLTQPPRGRAGGEFTDKGLQALGEGQGA